jgi:cytoskeleton protein RodZ
MSSEVMNADDSDGVQFALSGFGPAHAGLLLSQARQERGLTIDELSSQLKVAKSKLELLEQGRFEAMGDSAVYVRAIARAVCKALKIDEKPVMELMPKGASFDNLVDDRPALGEAFSTSDRMGRLGVRVPVVQRDPEGGRWWMVAAALAVLATALLFAWPYVQPYARNLMAAMSNGAEGNAAPAVNGNGAVKPVSVDTTPSKNPSLPAISQIPTDPAGSNAVVQSTAPSVAAPASAVAAAEPLPAETTVVAGADSAAINDKVLTLVAGDTSWIEIKNDAGQVLFSRTLAAGERIEQSLDRKRIVTVGNAGATTVWVRGAAMDIAPHTRDNVARFEVK